MIERAIENWLTNTNEKNYQTPFCQVLIHKGHKIIYISPHRPMEQGKDIITIDENGDNNAYQLKSGNIDLKRWREIAGEIRELIELPILHSAVDKSKIHKSWLVTNGDITDEVRIQIDQINEDNQRKGRNYSYLDVISGPILLQEFISAQGSFIPKELSDFRLFLDLYLADGSDFVPKNKLFNFLNATIFEQSTRSKSISQSLNAISASIIITAYLLNPYQNKENVFTLFEAWTSLAACIIRFAIKNNLKKADFEKSLEIVFMEIIRNLSLLKNEVTQREDFLEGDWHCDGGRIYRARTTITLGTLSLLEIHFYRDQTDYVVDKKILQLILENRSILWYWGDSAFSFFFYLIKFLELANEKVLANSLLLDIFKGIIRENAYRSPAGLPNPYYNVQDILDNLLDTRTITIDFRQFSGSSYTLELLISMMVRRNMRDELQKNWRQLSHIQFKRFEPDNIEDFFAWGTREGTNYSNFPNQTQSWRELVQSATDTQKPPDLLMQYEQILWFLLLVMPHRLNRLIVDYFDTILA